MDRTDQDYTKWAEEPDAIKAWRLLVARCMVLMHRSTWASSQTLWSDGAGPGVLESMGLDSGWDGFKELRNVLHQEACEQFRGEDGSVQHPTAALTQADNPEQYVCQTLKNWVRDWLKDTAQGKGDAMDKRGADLDATVEGRDGTTTYGEANAHKWTVQGQDGFARQRAYASSGATFKTWDEEAQEYVERAIPKPYYTAAQRKDNVMSALERHGPGLVGAGPLDPVQEPRWPWWGHITCGDAMGTDLGLQRHAQKGEKQPCGRPEPWHLHYEDGLLRPLPQWSDVAKQWGTLMVEDVDRLVELYWQAQVDLVEWQSGVWVIVDIEGQYLQDATPEDLARFDFPGALMAALDARGIETSHEPEVLWAVALREGIGTQSCAELDREQRRTTCEGCGREFYKARNVRNQKHCTKACGRKSRRAG